MSMFGQTANCGRCGKKVFAAEQKLAEGNVWHNGCWALEFKDRERAKKQHVDNVSYNKIADANASVEVRAALEQPRQQATTGTAEFDPAFSNAKKAIAPGTHKPSTTGGVTDTDTCSRCGKRVFHAEHRIAEGAMWHQMCWTKEFKEREEAKRNKTNTISYNAPADVKPAYFRVEDIDENKPARMETSDQERSSSVKSSNSCSSCNRGLTGGEAFCPGCGTRQ